MLNIIWLKLRIATKLTIALAIAAYLVFFGLFNLNKKVELWYWFGHDSQVPLLTALTMGMLAGILLVGVCLMGWVTIKQIKKLRDLQRVKAEAAAQDLANQPDASDAVELSPPSKTNTIIPPSEPVPLASIPEPSTPAATSSTPPASTTAAPTTQYDRKADVYDIK